MTKYILSYDLAAKTSGMHDTFKDQLTQEGWDDCFKSKKYLERRRLPETTLLGTFKDGPSALQAYQNATKVLKPRDKIRKVIIRSAPDHVLVESDEQCDE